MLVPFGAWQPDQRTIRASGAATLENVIPIDGGGYRPSPAFLPVVETGFSGPAFGSGLFTGQYDLTYAYFGTATDIYRFTSQNVVSVGNGYSASNLAPWSMDAINGKVLALNSIDGLQSAEVSPTGVFAAVPTAPTGSVLFVTNESVFIGNQGGNDTNKLSWSAQGDETNWIPDTVTGAGEQQLPENLGAIMGGMGGIYTTIFQFQGITRAHFIGGDLIYRFQTLDETKGLIASKSLVPVGQNAFFYSQEGFCFWNGQTATHIGNDQVDRWFRERGGDDSLDVLRGVWDQKNQVVRWYWEGQYSLGFHPKSQQWFTGNIPELGIDGTFTPLVSLTEAYDLDTEHPQEQEIVESVDGLPESFDDIFWNSPLRVVGGVMGDSFGLFAGENAKAVLETVDITDTRRRSLINEVYLDVDAENTTAIDVSLGTKDFVSGDDLIYRDPVQKNRAGIYPVLGQGRFFRVKAEIPQGATWKSISGMEVEPHDAGRF